MKIELEQEWEVGAQIGEGGFGVVREAASADEPNAVAKFVPKAPGATREMLFVNLAGIRNVVPVIDSGEVSGHWVLVMPRADEPLRRHIDLRGPAFDDYEVIAVLADVLAALEDMSGRVVHRDIKPENILRLQGRWCLADFGISRYAEATTAPDTHKHSLSPAYAAPERWRSERATTATDVYAVGVVGYEMLAGARPFRGPTSEDLREQHLHETPGPLQNISRPLVSLIMQCLYKPPQARPAPSDLLRQLPRSAAAAALPGLALLQDANYEEVDRRAERARAASGAASEMDRRSELFVVASQGLEELSERVRSAILDAAPNAAITRSRSGADWSIELNGAELWLSAVEPFPGRAAKIDVIAIAGIGVSMPPDHRGYRGRSHSLWFSDARSAGGYAWFETAFMPAALSGRTPAIVPFAAQPDEAASAVGPGVADLQVAWPFTKLDDSAFAAFADRWAGWLAVAAARALHLPTRIPEHAVTGSWRA